MCKYFSCIVTRKLKIVWDANNSSHEELITKSGLKDDKLENRDFVRLELVPNQKGFFTQKKEDWVYSVDEKGTLPEWYVKNEERIKELTWLECQKSFSKYKMQLKAVGEFLQEIPKIKYFDFHGKIQADWNVSFGINLAAAWDAAWGAAWDAARGTAWDAAWGAAWDAARGAARDAARDAARGAAWDAAWDAARDAARDAAWDAAWDAARDAARGAAWDAAWDAAIFARCLLVKDKIAKKHFNHAKARMQVWKAGYGLKCDVNGKLFVYAIKTEKEMKTK